MLRIRWRWIVWLFDGNVRLGRIRFFPTHPEPFECGPMGVFIAQALTVLLGLALMVLSLALLVLVAAARREQSLRVARLVLQPARGSVDRTNGSIRSAIDRGSAAPSRAP